MTGHKTLCPAIVRHRQLRATRFLYVSILLASLAIGIGCNDTTKKRLVGTWLFDTNTSSGVTLAADGSFVSVFQGTNHVIALTYQGTWQVRGSDFIMTLTNVNASGSRPHELVGSVDRLTILELDSDHITFKDQVAANYVGTNVWVRTPWLNTTAVYSVAGTNARRLTVEQTGWVLNCQVHDMPP